MFKAKQTPHPEGFYDRLEMSIANFKKSKDWRDWLQYRGLSSAQKQTLEEEWGRYFVDVRDSSRSYENFRLQREDLENHDKKMVQERAEWARGWLANDKRLKTPGLNDPHFLRGCFVVRQVEALTNILKRDRFIRKNSLENKVMSSMF